MELTIELGVLLAIAAVVVLFVNGIVEIIKKTFKNTKKYAALISIAIGILIGLALQPFTGLPFYTMGAGGFIAGLTAAGGFDLAKALTLFGPKDKEK